MAKRTQSPSPAPQERAAEGAAAPAGYCMRLYITGATPRSGRAIKNIQRICDRYVAGNYTLDVVDLYEQPGRAAEGQVIAAPTLVREQPQPVRRLVGDLSDEQRVLGGLGLP